MHSGKRWCLYLINQFFKKYVEPRYKMNQEIIYKIFFDIVRRVITDYYWCELCVIDVKCSWWTDKGDDKVPDNSLSLWLLVNILSIRVTSRESGWRRHNSDKNSWYIKSRQWEFSRKSMLMSSVTKLLHFIVEIDWSKSENYDLNALRSSICLCNGRYRSKSIILY